MPADLISPMGQAALQYARRGWPVFPCRECSQSVTTAAGAERVFSAKAPYTGKGLKDATRDEARITAWWKQHPEALIGLPVGPTGCFVIDFDPREDAVTGEVWTLATLKADLEAQIGVALPESLAAITQSDGVHLWFRQPGDGGAPIRNRGNLPRHVDVRGDGGYVIAPPSVMTETGRYYRWLRGGDWRDDASIAAAPPELVAVLRAPKDRAAPPDRAADAAPNTPAGAAASADDDIRKYGLTALDGECRAIRSARSGGRNAQLNESAMKIASLVAAGAIDAGTARAAIEAAARDNPGRDDVGQLAATINSGWTAGMNNPRNLDEIAAAAHSRRERRGSYGPSRAAPPAPGSPMNGKPSSRGGGDGANDVQKGAGAALDADLALKCAGFAMTDLGNLQRFLARYGRDFLCVAAWAQNSTSPGYVAWDAMRWNRSMADALFGRAAQETMRAIQEEADFIRASGVPFPPEEGDLPDPDADTPPDPDAEAAEQANPTAAEKAFLKAEAKRIGRRSAMWYLQRSLARHTRHDGPRHDYIVQVKSTGEVVLFSDKLAAWGRTSEGAGHIECIRKLAPARLSARPEDFDADPLALNVQNGTLVFHRPADGTPARVELREHRREDKITKLARATYDPAALCPQFDAFVAQVQPDGDMREFLRRWAGYNALGIADAQVMALFYGEGSNGKGVWVQTHAHILGDYAWATGIETFMDSGFKRNGAGPAPHLAALAGRRMVYANEPEDNSKFSDGLVKALTSDEPIGGVRELFGPAFELMITFTNTVMANNLPKIGTDFGIRRRMQVVPWGIVIAKEQQDKRLKDKLHAEMAGILNQMISGALAYLTEGLTMPEAMVEATKAYHDDNDLLGQFLTMCVAREPGNTIGAKMLHDLFKGWQTWAGLLPQNGQPWSLKKLRTEMERKGFKINKSSTMKWHDIVLRYEPLDFTDGEGRAVERDLPPPRHADKPSAGQPVRAGDATAVPDAVPPSPLPPTSFDDDDGFDAGGADWGEPL